MKLHEAVKEIVNQFGGEIVCETRLANLVADFNGFEEYPAVRRVFREMLKAGYGKTLYEESVNNPSNATSISHELALSFAQASNFKEDLACYSFDAVIYGLGLVDNVSEPLTKGFVDPISKTGDILVDLDKKLSDLQYKYLDLLNKSATLPKDILRDAPGFFTTEAMTALYELEYKIKAIQQQLNQDETDWCKQKRELKLHTLLKRKTEAVEKFLTELKDKYNNTLESYTVIPKILYVKCSGVINKEGEGELNSIEKEIRIAYSNLGMPYDDWCRKERLSHLESCSISNQDLWKNLLCKIFIPIIVLIVVLGLGIAYITSLSYIKEFDAQIHKGEQKTSEFQYAEAIRIFDCAKENYNGSFKMIYRNAADKRIDENIDMALSSCSSMIEKGDLLEAASLLASLPDSIINANDNKKEKLDSEKEKLQTAIDKWVEVLIQNIADNKGHLDAGLLKEVDAIAEVAPYHYWLDLIKNKEQ